MDKYIGICSHSKILFLLKMNELKLHVPTWIHFDNVTSEKCHLHTITALIWSLETHQEAQHVLVSGVHSHSLSIKSWSEGSARVGRQSFAAPLCVTRSCKWVIDCLLLWTIFRRMFGETERVSPKPVTLINSLKTQVPKRRAPFLWCNLLCVHVSAGPLRLQNIGASMLILLLL